MGHFGHSEQSLRDLAEIIRQHGSVTEAARVMGLNPATVRARYAVLKARGPSLGIDVPPTSGKVALRIPTTSTVTPAERSPLPVTADGYWSALDSLIGRTPKDVVPPSGAPGRRERIVVAGDFHAPFHEPELVARMVREEAGADVLIVNGDVQDFYSISRFTKYERVTIEEELAAVDALLGTFARSFREVVLVCGNHDRPRFERQLRTSVSQDVIDVIQFLTGGTLDPLAVLAKRYPNISLARHTVGRHAIGWFYQRGDLLCAHAEKFSRVPGTALRTIHEWLTERASTLGLSPWRVLVQAHTHQLGLLPWMADSVLIEGGCMCQTHGYQLDAKIAGRPQRRGYVTLEQEDGRTDPNSVRLYWWDHALDR